MSDEEATPDEATTGEEPIADETPTGEGNPRGGADTDAPPDPDAEWTAAGEEIRTLGEHFKRHYSEPSEDEAEPAPSSDELKEAARAFGRSFGRFVGALGNAARDPEVKETAKRAGSRVLDAFSTTFEQLGKEAKGAFEKSDEEPGDAMEEATRELDDADLLDELKADLAEDEDGTT